MGRQSDRQYRQTNIYTLQKKYRMEKIQESLESVMLRQKDTSKKKDFNEKWKRKPAAKY